VITAIMSDHQNWYSSMESYVADKRVIYAGQTKEDATIAGDGSWGESFLRETTGRPLHYRPDLVPEKTLVRGDHQRQNLAAAAAALSDLGYSAEAIRSGLASFGGVEHRLELFHSMPLEGGNGSGASGKGLIHFYNDSAATIPEAAAAALYALAAEGPVSAVTGGTDKNLDFTPLAEAFAKTHAAPALLAGTGSEKLARLLDAAGVSYAGPYPSLEEAYKAALQKARGMASSHSGDVSVVLTPGCASFGMFLNEFDRGRKWKAIVSGS